MSLMALSILISSQQALDCGNWVETSIRPGSWLALPISGFKFALGLVIITWVKAFRKYRIVKQQDFAMKAYQKFNMILWQKSVVSLNGVSERHYLCYTARAVQIELQGLP